MILSEYLRAACGTPGAWGRCDCFMFAADWVVSQTGQDFAASYRGRYRTERGALRHIAKFGSFQALVETCMTDIGLVKTDGPVMGDIGLIDSPYGPTLAIRSAKAWVIKAPAGVGIVSLPVLAAWSVPCRS